MRCHATAAERWPARAFATWAVAQEISEARRVARGGELAPEAPEQGPSEAVCCPPTDPTVPQPLTAVETHHADLSQPVTASAVGLSELVRAVIARQHRQ